MTLLVRTEVSVDSATGTTDSQGLFSLTVPLAGRVPDTVGLRVSPRGESSYLISPLDCDAVSRGGDACVLSPLLAVPTFAAFRFLYRRAPDSPVANARVTFRRTGGARISGTPALDSVTLTTDEQGFAFPFGFDRGATSLDPIVGDLTVELPAPTGTVRRSGYQVRATPHFNDASVVVQLVGPSLSYVMLFTDSISGKPVEKVEMRFERRAGVPTSSEADTASSIVDGRAFLNLSTAAQGSLTGDFFVTPPGSGRTTAMTGIVLPTFEADSSIIFARWKIGATGVLYPVAPP
jgi:hypothetical protein